MEKLHCWKCNLGMERIKDKFQGFQIDAWKCLKCGEIVYDESVIQPLLNLRKLRDGKITSTIGMLGKSTIVRIPKAVEQLYHITKGKKVEFELEEGVIKLRV